MPDEEHVSLKEFLDLRIVELEKRIWATFVSRREVITLMLSAGAVAAALIAITILALR